MRSSLFASICLVALTFLSLGCSTPTTSPSGSSNITKQAETSPSPTKDPTKSTVETSSPSPAKDTAQSGNESLSTDQVMRNVAAYKGRRVRWLGSIVAMSTKGKITRHAFTGANMTAEESIAFLKSGKGFQAFVAEFNNPLSLEESATMMLERSKGWVTGTIKGTDTFVVQSGAGALRSKKVPLLVNAVFEKDNGNR